MPTPPATNQAAMSTTRRRLLGVAGVGVAAGVAGCASTEEPTQPSEATLTIRLRNGDDEPRAYEIRVTQDESLTNSFSGVLPADQAEPAEIVATVRATEEQHDFTINTDGGQRGQTWEPTDCGAFLVDAVIEDGEPTFETQCQDG